MPHTFDKRYASLLEAIRIMLEVGPALQAEEQQQKATRQSVLEAFERMGVKANDSLK